MVHLEWKGRAAQRPGRAVYIKKRSHAHFQMLLWSARHNIPCIHRCTGGISVHCNLFRNLSNISMIRRRSGGRQAKQLTLNRYSCHRTFLWPTPIRDIFIHLKWAASGTPSSKPWGSWYPGHCMMHVLPKFCMNTSSFFPIKDGDLGCLLMRRYLFTNDIQKSPFNATTFCIFW